MKVIILKIYRKCAGLLSNSRVKYWPFLRKVHGFVVLTLAPKSTDIDGHKIFLDANDSLDLSTKPDFEPLETKLVKSIIKKGNVVLDIGAHIGYYTLIMAKLVGEKGKVFAFEPEPKNFALLKKNIETNCYKNVVLEKKAVADKNQELKLYLYRDTGTHRVHTTPDSFAKSYANISIKAVRLDDYFTHYKNYRNRIDFIKMDIEGAEYAALKGMKKLLQKNKDIKLVVEFYPKMLVGCGVRPSDYLSLLEKQGFKFYNLDDKKNKIEIISKASILKKYPTKGEVRTNLLCTRKLLPSIKSK